MDGRHPENDVTGLTSRDATLLRNDVPPGLARGEAGWIQRRRRLDGGETDFGRVMHTFPCLLST